ncbi:hypothetical protein [Pyxidicoccus fallax]|nr:hypothetical protein [Pyxidicoccus fallax]
MDGKIEFFLATVDPSGNPSTDVMSYCDTTWYQDQGSHKGCTAGITS